MVEEKIVAVVVSSSTARVHALKLHVALGRCLSHKIFTIYPSVKQVHSA